jgi:hypothetical protein
LQAESMMDLSLTIMDTLLPVLQPLISRVKEKHGGKCWKPRRKSG